VETEAVKFLAVVQVIVVRCRRRWSFPSLAAHPLGSVRVRM
jgi:hypothetical protein